MHKLAYLDTSEEERYGKVEVLLQGVNEAQAILKVVGAKAEIFNDASLVAQLVAKLSDSGQEQWHLDWTSPEAVANQVTSGVWFLAWLERQGEAANSARICQQALSLTRQATARDTKNRTKIGKAFAAAGRPPPNQRLRAPTKREPGQQYGSRSPDHIPRKEWAQKLLTEEGAKEIRLTAQTRTGSCPVCWEPHVYHRRLPWGSISWPISRLQDCRAFQALSRPQRARVFEEKEGCTTCLSWTHPSSKCPLKEPKNPGPGTVSLRCQEREGRGYADKPTTGCYMEVTLRTPLPTQPWELLGNLGSPGQTCSWEGPWAAF